jgi:hypothetical protein
MLYCKYSFISPYNCIEEREKERKKEKTCIESVGWIHCNSILFFIKTELFQVYYYDWMNEEIWRKVIKVNKKIKTKRHDVT